MLFHCGNICHDPAMVTWMHKQLSIQLTYYAKDSDKNEIVYMDIIDRIQQMFSVGVRINDRYLKIESVEDDRVGEENDVLSITIEIPYVERVYKDPDDTAEPMEEVDIKINDRGGHSDQEVFPGKIDKDTV